MSDKERKRLIIMEKVLRAEMTLIEASRALAVSYRQTKRIHTRYQNGGAYGLIHQSRGKPSNRRIAQVERDAILKGYQLRYKDFGPTLASEYLAEDGYAVNPETLRRWLIDEGLWARKRKRAKHRTRRTPKKCFGELLQLDGSHHDWFEGRRAPACLMNLVDDATGKTMSIMSEEETTFSAMELLELWIRRYGIPEALYCDLKSVYLTTREPTNEELISGKLPRTQFGRACDELGIAIIPAYSAQAKGRVERNHGVYQDRFVKELRLKNISTIDEANGCLHGGFIAKLNNKFGRKPACMTDRHIPLRKENNLRAIFCIKTERCLSNDWVIRHENCFFQVIKKRYALPPPKSKIVVHEWQDGTVELRWKGESLDFCEIDAKGKIIDGNRSERGHFYCGQNGDISKVG